MKAAELGDRLLEFAARCFGLGVRLCRSAAGRYLADQLIRSSASAGANYEEARGAESRADFLHKLQLVLKELRESGYWLKLISRTAQATGVELAALMAESEELVRIFVKAVVTAKSRR